MSKQGHAEAAPAQFPMETISECPLSATALEAELNMTVPALSWPSNGAKNSSEGGTETRGLQATPGRSLIPIMDYFADAGIRMRRAVTPPCSTDLLVPSLYKTTFTK